MALLFLILLITGTGCQKKENSLDIELPTTNILAVKSTWGVITSTYLRVRDEPTVSSSAVTLLGRGDILEIISQDSHKQEVEGIMDYWYEILYDGIQGWVFGHYIQLFENRHDALDAARSLD